jgi:hypothetical protein
MVKEEAEAKKRAEDEQILNEVKKFATNEYAKLEHFLDTSSDLGMPASLRTPRSLVSLASHFTVRSA